MEGAVKGMPLERKLPLLMTGVLLVIVASGVIIVDREVRRAAAVVTTHHVEETAATIAHLVEGTGQRMADAFRPVATDSTVLRVLAAGTATSRELAVIKDALHDLASPADSGLVSELWAADGRIIASTGDVSAHNGRPAGAAVATGADSVAVGSLYATGGRVYYWTTMPLHIAGRRVGRVAQRSRLDSQPAVEKTFVNLSGENVTIFFRNTDGSLWSTLGGSEVNPPSRPGKAGEIPTFDHAEVSHGRVMVYESKVVGTPWTIAVELPLSAIGTGPRDLLNRFALMSLLLLILGAVAVWIISRRITSPLVKMTAAAEAMARGDYSNRVNESGDYEIARLGASFNRMAAEVEAANQNLQSMADTEAKAKVVAEEANAAKANFLAAMSHELRTPLNAIAGYVDLLQMGIRGPLTSEQTTDLSRIRRSQQYLLGLIEQILVFTQLDARQIAIQLQDVSVDELMRDAETMVEPQMRARGIEYSRVACDPGLVVRADRDKAQQIVLNLLTNGTKYTNPGGSLTASCEMCIGSVHVRVSDTGAGIPDKMLSHIFEPFVQLDRRLNQPREGVGLGLTISRDLARAMGGDLLVESTVGVGSTFTLVLPGTDARETT